MLTPATETEAPAPAATSVATEKPAPASDPVIPAGKERNADGTFKADAPVVEDAPGVKKRIGAALAKQRAAEERAEAAEAALALAKPGSQPATETAQQPVAAKVKKPESKDFDTYEAFNEALVDYKMSETRAAEAKAASERAALDVALAAGLAWNERVAKVTSEVHADYADVMAEASDMPISKAMNDTIFEMPRGPEVAYFLAKNPDECARIAKLKPYAAAAELGVIQKELAAAVSGKPAKPAPARLPKPAANVGGAAAPYVIDLNDENLPQATFNAEFKKRLKAS